MTSLWLILVLLLHAASAGKLTEEENEERKEKCKSGEPQVATRAKRRQPVEASEYPYAAAFSRIDVYHGVKDLNTGKVTEFQSMCSGVLISPRHILTAAHCLIDSENSCSHNNWPLESIDLFLQSDCKEAKCWTEENSHKSASVFVHPEYCKTKDGGPAKKARNDIAVVELRESVNIAPICMPEVDSAISDQKEFESIGYGKGDGQRRIQSLRYDKIEQVRGSITAYNFNMTKKNANVQGDSGALIRKFKGRHYLFGITSATQALDLTGAIQRPMFYAFFADVRKQLDWICDVSGVCAETTNRQKESIPSPM